MVKNLGGINPLRQIAKSLSRRWRVLLAAAVLAGMAWGSSTVWRHARRQLRDDLRYQVTAASIEVPPVPSWIRTDIKSESLQQAGLRGSLSVLDPPKLLQERLASAFQFHPWVNSVNRVAIRAPNRVQIDLTYRQPLASVQMAVGQKLLPVDAAGILLPAKDLTEVELRSLPRITRITTLPRVGEAWRDPRLLGAVAFVQELGADWARLHLVDVIPSQRPEIRGERRFYRYELRTRGGTRIVWGASPRERAPSEASFDVKLARLKGFVQKNGALDSIQTPAVIDLRNGLKTQRRTVKRAKPAEEASEGLK